MLSPADVKTAIRTLIDRLPREFTAFDKTEFPMPISQAILGELPDIGKLRAWLAEAAGGELKNLCEPVAVASEIVEAGEADRSAYYMDDHRVRRYVFRGAKWKAGWVLPVGGGITREFIDRLAEEEYLTFSPLHIETLEKPKPPRDIHPLPFRETAAVYFLQLMVRYAMTWGQIPPGEDHEMGHFLERDMPGAMVVRGEVGTLEGLLLLAVMKLGCPAVVDEGFPFEIGPRSVAESDDQFLQALLEFPNMRVRRFQNKVLSLPEGTDPLFAREEITAERSIRGCFQLRPGKGDGGVTVSGDPSSDPVAVTVKVDDPRMDLPVSSYLESVSLRSCSYIHGIGMRREEGEDCRIVIDVASDASLDPRLLGEVISTGLAHKYPRLGPVSVAIRFGADAFAEEVQAAREFEAERREAVRLESEETAEEFHLCIDCQPFSQAHVCVVTPGRPPVCSRSPYEIKAGAIWGVDYRPWTRRKLGSEELQYVVPKGRVIDPVAGEWEGVNQAASKLTDGKIRRIRLHAVGEFPPPSCGCFGAIAFSLPEVGGIGVMHRGYEGTAPKELTSILLANRAGGKQHPGVCGFSPRYLRSPMAFAAEGGLTAVKWATRKLYDIMKPYLPQNARIATEDDATTLGELQTFLKR